MFKSDVKSEQMLVYPTDPDWWKERTIKPEEVIAYFELYEYRFGNIFDHQKLFSKNPNFLKIFADQLAKKIFQVIKGKKLDVPKWVVGDSVFAKEVAGALKINFLSHFRYLQERGLKKVRGRPVLRIETTISSRKLLTDYSKLRLFPLIGSCICTESALSGSPEIVSLAVI